jgi:uncharacterized protein YidB (DUF937 family)
MGLLDQITGLFGGDQAKAIDAIKNLLDPNGPIGGLEGLKSKFEAAGLGDKINSWIGTGPSQSITPDEIKRALPDQVQNISTDLGKSPDDVATQLSELLPDIVNKLTPDGVLPDTSSLMDKLGGLAKMFD